MGILEKNKKLTKTPFNSSNIKNIQKNGNKKAYSLNYQNEKQNINSKVTCEILAEHDEIFHDNPAFESDFKIKEKQKNTFESQSLNKEQTKNESFILENHNHTNSTDIQNFDQINEGFYHFYFNYQGISTITSINNTEKLAAAAAAAVSYTAESLVEFPNFGQELSTMMKHNRVDEIEKGSKKTECNLVQNNEYEYRKDSSSSKNIAKSPTINDIGDLGIMDDNAKLKLTGSASSYEIKIRRRRACHIKALVILVALLTAGFIGCLFTYYFMRYQKENQKYLSYTQNMVLERASKLGSNKLEILVPFTTNVTDIEDKNILVNKIEEIVHKSFIRMNKTVDLIQLYELNELSANSFLATFNVELKDASQFSNVVLRKESETRIKIDDKSDILKSYRNNFFNVTLGLNILPEILSVNVSNVEILYDFKMIYSTLKKKQPILPAQANLELSNEKIQFNNKITKTYTPQAPSSLVSSTQSFVSKSIVNPTPELSISLKSDIVFFASTGSSSLSSESQSFLTISPLKTELQPNSIFPTKGIYRFLNTTSFNFKFSDFIKSNFTSKFIDDEKENFHAKDGINQNNILFKKLLGNNETYNSTNSKIVSDFLSSTDIPSNKILIAEILLKNGKEIVSSFNKEKKKENTNKTKNIKTEKLVSYLDDQQLLKPITNMIHNSNDINTLDIILQIHRNDTSFIDRILKEKSSK